MENFVNSLNLNKIKQPKPDISTSVDSTPKRAINRPYVGIIQQINPTETPVSDTFEQKKRDFPRVFSKGKYVDNSAFTFDNVLTVGTIICGALGLLSLFKKK